MRRFILVSLLALGCALPALLQAEHTRFWRQSDYAEFQKGTANGVALRSDGTLIPAPRFAQLADPNLAYLWTLQVDAHGRLYAAGGSNAKVLRFDETGRATTVFESPELAAQAIVLDAQDNLYVATSPDGKIYRVTPQGQRSVLFDPKTKYLWALALDARGNIFAGTGDMGQVFAISPGGEGKLFYKSDEHHARSLAFDAKGNLLIGTDPDGLVLRVETTYKKGLPEAGAAFVVYETERKEVTALLTKPSGEIFAASIGEKAHSTATQASGGESAAASLVAANELRTGTGAQTPPQQLAAVFPALSGGSEVYQIATDGAPQVLWSSRDDLVYSLGLSPAGKLLLGTGNSGKVIELDGEDVFTELVRTNSAQVTRIASGPGGKLYLATANPGKVFAVGPDYAADVSFESQPFDARNFSQWGRLTWAGSGGKTADNAAFYVRSGNTSNPENNWSPWAGPYKRADGDLVACPPARFVQWKLVFAQGGAGQPAGISWVSLAYQPKNVAPQIESIVLQDPGVRVQGFPNQGAVPGMAQPVPLRLPHSGSSANNAAAAAAAIVASQEVHGHVKVEIPPQGFAQKSAQGVIWSARDDNDDDLLFALYYRGEGETSWKLMKDKIEQHYYSWDTSSMPDGTYYLKLTASDAPSNPPSEALSTERESDTFQVDNNPPEITALRAEKHAGHTIFEFSARDSASAISKAEYSLDAGDWEILFPVGRLTDSPSEEYKWQLENLPPGEHTLAVRVFDRFENSATSKVTFTVDPGTRVAR